MVPLKVLAVKNNYLVIRMNCGNMEKWAEAERFEGLARGGRFERSVEMCGKDKNLQSTAPGKSKTQAHRPSLGHPPCYCDLGIEQVHSFQP